MNKIIIKLKLVALCFFITGHIVAQQKLTKVSQSIHVDKDVVVNLNTSYCNIVFDTWNKDTVEIEAYVEGDALSKEALEDAMKQWKVDVDASSNEVSITTSGGHAASFWVHDMQDDNHGVVALLNELKFELAEMPEVNFDCDFEMPELPEIPEMPEMPEMSEMPELPELPEGVNAIAFDYDKYQKDGEKYLEAWSQKFESKYGKDYAKKMEAWGEKFGKEWNEKYGDDFAKKMEAWGEKFGEQWGEDYAKKMEAWGERFAKRMEAQASRVEAQAERAEAQAERMAEQKERLIEQKAHALERKQQAKERIKERTILIKDREKEVERLFHNTSNSNVKKTIKIKMPKKAKLKVNVKHGEIEFAANVDNLEANLAYTKFTAQSINGSLTSINASYSPIVVTNWNLGELNLNYVKNADLENVAHLVLNVNSSEVDIENLTGSAMIDCNIGDVDIYNIEDTFNNLNVILQNSNAVIGLPKAECNIQYKGTHSRVTHPDKLSKDSASNFSTGDLASGKNIMINAKYSHVTMQ